MAHHMKAVVFKRYGEAEVLQIVELEKPIPKANEVVVRIHATSVTAEDPKMRSFNPSPLLKLPVGLMYGFKKPKKPVLGMEFSGKVESVGNEVKNYKSGDQIFGYTGVGFGAYAEYKCLPENSIMYFKPENLSFEQSASMVNGFLTVVAYLKKKAKVKKGDRVLIYGASGSVGTAAVQLAKHLGATVTAICSTRNVELVKSIGADYVIDYTKENFADRNETYDVIFDTIGKTSMKDCMNLLNPRGKYLLTEFGILHILNALYSSLFRSKKVIVTASNMYWKKEDLTFLKELVETGHFKPVLDRSFRLDEIVEAHKYVETGHKVGNVAILVQQDN